MSHRLKRKLTPKELREKLCDPRFLPTHEQVVRSFGSWEQWRNFCFNRDNPVFEFLNQEYLEAFAGYLVNRIDELGKNEKNPLTILELGAGNGKLSHFLRVKIEKKTPKKTVVIATEPGEWNLRNYFKLEKLDHLEALRKYSPDIVIFSWMPYKKDVTNDIRKFDSVKEYILIGETDGGCCGDEGGTWGCGKNKNEQKPPYASDGFQRKDLDNLSAMQICRTDEPGEYHHSKTVSFKRRQDLM